MKVCSRCKIEKEDGEFYKDKRCTDGLYSDCKKCNYKYSKDYQRRYYMEGKRRLYIKERVKTKEYKDWRKKYLETYKVSTEEIKFKIKCRRKSSYLIKKGVVKKLPCIICNNLRVEAHHEDYNKPEKVLFFCIRHHTEFHDLKVIINYFLMT